MLRCLGSRFEARNGLMAPAVSSRGYSVSVLSGGEKGEWPFAGCSCRSLNLPADEPTNHLDAETVSWLEHHLQRYEAPSLPSPMTVTSWTTWPLDT